MLRKGNILDGAETRTIEASQRIDAGSQPASGSILDWVLINAKGKNGNLETRGPLGKHGGDRPRVTPQCLPTVSAADSWREIPFTPTNAPEVRFWEVEMGRMRRSLTSDGNSEVET